MRLPGLTLPPASGGPGGAPARAARSARSGAAALIGQGAPG